MVNKLYKFKMKVFDFLCEHFLLSLAGGAFIACFITTILWVLIFGVWLDIIW